MTPAEIIAAARQALGTKFKHQGRTVGRGLDCAGLALHVAAVLGVETIDREGYARRPFDGILESMLDAQPGLERVFAMLPGDILLMRFDVGPQHLGIFTGATIIHAYAPPGLVCEHAMTPEWESRAVRIYRFRGVTHG